MRKKTLSRISIHKWRTAPMRSSVKIKTFPTSNLTTQISPEVRQTMSPLVSLCWYLTDNACLVHDMSSSSVQRSRDWPTNTCASWRWMAASSGAARGVASKARWSTTWGETELWALYPQYWPHTFHPREHIESNHIDCLTFNCPFCNKEIKNRVALRSHISKNHREENLRSKGLVLW